MSVDSTYVTGTHAIAGALVEQFTAAPPAQLPEAYERLVRALWDVGAPTDSTQPATAGSEPESFTLPAPADVALPLATEIVASLDRVDDHRAGYLLILLGLLAEADSAARERQEPGDPDGSVREAVRQGMDHYLHLLSRVGPDEPLTQAVVYLLAHFPEDRDRILPLVEPLGLEEGDLSRLDRCLRTLDLDAPDLGRVWPSPSVWQLTDEERDFDKAWIGALTPEQVAVNWRNDTRTVWGYVGSKAYWAVRHGMPVAVAGVTEPPSPSSESGDGSASSVPEPGIDIFTRHAAALRCPSCQGPLDFRAGGVRCARCAVTYPVTRGILDLTEGVSDAAGVTDEVTANLLAKLAEMPSMGLYYESRLRPEFLRVAGGNWGGAVTLADEDAYIAQQVSPVDGPVLDLAAGAGRWTSVIAETVGAERLIALDMGLPMLNVLRRRVPAVPAVRSSALALPFEDASLGAVICWNALQAFPDDAATAIAEVGRCLRLGGTFTLMTFVWDRDPVARHFQASHYFPSRPAGMLLFEPDELRRWLADANMIVRDQSGPESFAFLTAERVA
ncbi:methyltransferase domain-containing protein [Planotetraspora sp. A-T 1434]|uniref:class I SAM-dependent methyltransferase n=1 Tax=Planotetraspora sp. A-T 1434 TaxID=2979219 RepID=UPI0021C21C13|nr:class I SAM-dependent methyltransferase [Planotetraspora sp. A-T 1434]MCT9933178.1 methyltransferase domain-containing protein [Planotetraspora sp. A-T 1434]